MLASVLALSGAAAARQDNAGPIVALGFDGGSQTLSENRPIKGISLPGMPSGAPGMPGRKTAPLHVYYISNTSPPQKFASF